jgi:hypothetical protein
LTAETGNVSAGDQFIAAAPIKALNAITSAAAGAALAIAPAAAASKVWVGGTPNVFWANVTSGKVDVIVTYIEAI